MLFISGGKSFEKWEVKDIICTWLMQNMLEEHCGCFRENKVRGSTLLLTLKDGTLKMDLKDIGVKAPGKSSHFIIEFSVSSYEILIKSSQKKQLCYKTLLIIGLIMVFGGILTGRQSGQKLQCLFFSEYTNKIRWFHLHLNLHIFLLAVYWNVQ